MAVVVLACGSLSMSRVRRSEAASEAERFMAVVVLPTPPFWFAMDMTRDIASGTGGNLSGFGEACNTFHVEHPEGMWKSVPRGTSATCPFQAQAFHVEQFKESVSLPESRAAMSSELELELARSSLSSVRL